MGLSASGGEGWQVAHSSIFIANIGRILGREGELSYVPTEFIQMERRIAQLAAHPPKPGVNGFWFLWDNEKGYVESDIPLNSDLLIEGAEGFEILEQAAYDRLQKAGLLEEKIYFIYG